MSLHLLYIGAAAGSAPAASLRALAGAGAVFVPAGLEPELAAALAEARDGALTEFVPANAGALWERAAATIDETAVCIAGPGAPALARALRGEAARRGVPVSTTPAGTLFDDALLGQELVSLKRVVDRLRVECPWDREQTAADIVSYTVEEVYELADAIAGDDLGAEHGELGDLLLQVVLLALMLDERQAGDLGSVAHDIETKLIRRHAHIFGDAVAETPGEVRGQWERIKRDQEGREGVFHDVPETFPALLYSRKVQQRAGSVGFDWDTVAEAFPKIAEEHAELAEVLGLTATGAPAGGAPIATDQARLRHEFGDLLFAVVNVARKAGVDAELALRAASQRFVDRVETAVVLAADEGVDWSTLALPDQDRYYRRAKSAESGRGEPSHQEGPASRSSSMC
jgi:MazG family protein